MIVNMELKKILSTIVTELFLKVFKTSIQHSYFKVPESKTLNATHCFNMKLPKQYRNSTSTIK